MLLYTSDSIVGMVNRIITVTLAIAIIISTGGVGIGTASASPVGPGVDSDGDGFSDEFEENCGLENMHPNEPDIYIEVDSTVNANLSQDTEEYLKKVYSKPWDENQTIHLHINRSQNDLPAYDSEISPDNKDDFVEYRSEYFDNSGRGYHYLLYTSRYPTRGVAWGSDAIAAGGMNVWYENFGIVSHEVGHTVGLYPDEFEGIDSNYNTNKYPSTMNYAYLVRVPGAPKPPDEIYSNGTNGDGDFNDWAEMEAENYGFDNVNITELDRIEGNNCSLSDTASEYDNNDDSQISLSELAVAASDYSDGSLDLADLSEVASAYAN